MQTYISVIYQETKYPFTRENNLTVLHINRFCNANRAKTEQRDGFFDINRQKLGEDVLNKRAEQLPDMNAGQTLRPKPVLST